MPVRLPPGRHERQNRRKRPTEATLATESCLSHRDVVHHPGSASDLFIFKSSPAMRETSRDPQSLGEKSHHVASGQVSDHRVLLILPGHSALTHMHAAAKRCDAAQRSRQCVAHRHGVRSLSETRNSKVTLLIIIAPSQGQRSKQSNVDHRRAM